IIEPLRAARSSTDASNVAIVSTKGPSTDVGPPATRLQRAESHVDRPFSPPQVLPVPARPDPGLVPAAKYAVVFARAWWQRGTAIKQLATEIKQGTEALDELFGALGKVARGARVEGRVFSAENTALGAAEARVAQFQQNQSEVERRKVEEGEKFVE